MHRLYHAEKFIQLELVFSSLISSRITFVTGGETDGNLSSIKISSAPLDSHYTAQKPKQHYCSTPNLRSNKQRIKSKATMLQNMLPAY